MHFRRSYDQHSWTFSIHTIEPRRDMLLSDIRLLVETPRASLRCAGGTLSVF
jgi:hypothetical protein